MSTSHQLGHQILNKEIISSKSPFFKQPRISRPHDSPHLQRPNDYLVKSLHVAVPNEDLQPRCPRPMGSYTVRPHTILAVEDPWPRESDSGGRQGYIPAYQRGPSMGNPYINPILSGYLWVIILKNFQRTQY